ncbi:MAG: glycosyltransferase family 2 protein [Clostridia bacterium]|nr:glycosyltransferase family 2 protein [Clostridia bacterium]
MEKYLVDIPVALIFFNRDDTLKSVFEQVRKAKPSKLFLIQDGARENREDDIEGIAACRKVVENVDWECEIFKNYSEENLGCGRRVSSGISWVFESVDRAIILEDDCVIEPTFINFCDELLEKYKDDERVAMISALNHFVDWDCGDNSYFFAKTGAIAAWATWKRVWDNFDFTIKYYNDDYVKKVIKSSFNHKYAANARMKNWQSIYERGQKGEKIRYWGPQFGFLKYRTTALSIVPSHTLSSNVGVGPKATFSGMGAEFMKKSMRPWFFQKTRPMEFPLKHPVTILPDCEYDKKYYDITYPNPIVGFITKTFYFCKRKLYSMLKK